MMMKKRTTLDLTLTAVFAALMAVCSWITVPAPLVPFTLQTFAVEAALFMLGGARGCAAIGIWLALGLCGVPVFSRFNGGAGYMLGPTGGYILGFLLTGLVWSLLEKKAGESRLRRLLLMAAAVAACYAAGTLWFWLFNGREKGMSLWRVLEICVIPFLIPDAAKLVLAEQISWRMRKIPQLR